jgi:hypothetical protein
MGLFNNAKEIFTIYIYYKKDDSTMYTNLQYVVFNISIDD